MKRYNPTEIEPKWQQIWDETQVYKADLKSDKQKYIAMSMFNYPSGAGIHIGHAMNYTISDVMARFKRQQGYESYHPVGWDAFGLPAENFAIKSGISPQASMAKIIPSYHQQYKAMGWSNDWSKEISTHLPAYYKWTQWIFSEMYRNKLAYQDSRMQWWCEKCQTVLANEQVIDGKCWRHDSPDDPLVFKKEVKQWFFKVTEYADEILEATDALDWTEAVKSAQKNWIGKSVGAEVDFRVDVREETITVFTTRPDTLFGVSFLVLAPEHELLASIVSDDARDVVDGYVKESLAKSELERQETKEKTGVPTGAYAINPINDEKIPIWVANYVLGGYGTGAVMGVPGHDDRDYEFAEKFDLPIKQVVAEALEDQTNPPRKDKEDTDRNVAMCVIEHPSDGTFLTLRWNKFGWHNLVMGGIEGNESVEVAARREIAEETGYTDMTYIDTMPVELNSKFYAKHKDVNRNIITRVLRFKLNSLTGIETQREAHEDFESEWVDRATLATLQPVSELGHILKWMKGERLLYHGEGTMVNSGVYDGKNSSGAREEIIAWLEEKGFGRLKTTYRIRDWSVSRQRYWGAPIPIINCETHGAVLVPDNQLPVVLPELEDFAPSGDGRSALARATDWLETTCPECGGPATRETDTLDTYICSSWYYLRYLDPANEQQAFGNDIANKWMPVDFYNGGDHATAHMIYARFMMRFFWHRNLVDTPEPFKRFLFNGKVTAADGMMFSKSKGNGIDPLEIISSGYGADSLRTYLMFAAPLDVWVRWDPQGVPGTYRFLNRIWNLVQEFTEAAKDDTESAEVLRTIHPAIHKVTSDLEHQKYNTAIAAMMEVTNTLYSHRAKSGFAGSVSWQFALSSLVALVAPFAPHIADELWSDLGNGGSVQRDSWPAWDKKYLVSDTITIVVQVNGKLRAKLEVARGESEGTIKELALSDENVANYVTSDPKKVIYIAGKLISIVV